MDRHGGTSPTSPVPSVTFTTKDLPARAQFEAYRADALGFAELFQHEPGLPCPASYTAWSLGSVVVKRTASPALDQRRTAEMARRDGLDHWVINLPLRSRQRIAMDEVRLDVSAARPFLSSGHQPYTLQRPEAESDWLICFVTRDAVPGLDLPAGMNGAEVLATPMGRLLATFLRQMGQRLPEMTLADRPGLHAATLALLRSTLAPSAENLQAARPHSEAVLRDRVRAVIRAGLGAASFTPHRLCREVGMSRSALYRVMEPLGGVAATITAERLAQARRGLENPADYRSIKDIAEAAGFYDPSVFTRTFRRRYGVTPSELRDAGRAGLPSAATITRPDARGFLDLVADMKA